MASAFMPGGGRGSVRKLLRGGDMETGPAGREVLHALLRSKAPSHNTRPSLSTAADRFSTLTGLLRGKQTNSIVAVPQGAIQLGDFRDEEDFHTESKGPTSHRPAPRQVKQRAPGDFHSFPPVPPPLEWYQDNGKENEGAVVHSTKPQGGKDPGLFPGAGPRLQDPTNSAARANTGLNQQHHKRPWWSQVMKGPSEPLVFDEDIGDEGKAEEVGLSSAIREVLKGTKGQHNEAQSRLLQPMPKRKGAPRSRLWGTKVRRKVSRMLSGRPKVKARKDLPKSKTLWAKGAKPNLARAISIAERASSAKGVIQRIEGDFYANSSRNAKEAKRRAVRNVLEAAFESAYPLSPDKLKLLAGAFREAGYKSADTYLVEAKTEHIEQGGEWSALLDRHFKLCVKAVKRGQGPRKKAPEVRLAPQLFAFGVLFMMREIEIANLSIADITLAQDERLVKVTWSESKMDQEGLSISRTLQCICQGGCDISCPYAVSEVLVHAAMLRGSSGAISVDKEGHIASKADLVKDWKSLFDIPVTGHSTRRSGALQYIRLGWSVPQVGFLGRWKSNVILSYAEEALETMAVNTPGKFGAPPEGPSKETQGSLKELLSKTKIPKEPDAAQEVIIAQIKADIQALKKGTKVLNENFQDSVELLRQKIESGHKYLPKFVTSTRYKVTHINHRVLLYAPAAHWRTICGWHYYSAGYHFEGDEGTAVSCTKCLGIAQSKEAEFATPEAGQ
eukprot:s1622_g7.t1